MNRDNWMHKSTSMKCLTCCFFVPKRTVEPVAVGEAVLGRCRKHAPTLNGWPAVFETDWCGDHKLDENKVMAQGALQRAKIVGIVGGSEQREVEAPQCAGGPLRERKLDRD